MTRLTGILLFLTSTQLLYTQQWKLEKTNKNVAKINLGYGNYKTGNGILDYCTLFTYNNTIY